MEIVLPGTPAFCCFWELDLPLPKKSSWGVTLQSERMKQQMWTKEKKRKRGLGSKFNKTYYSIFVILRLSVYWILLHTSFAPRAPKESQKLISRKSIRFHFFSLKRRFWSKLLFLGKFDGRVAEWPDQFLSFSPFVTLKDPRAPEESPWNLLITKNRYFRSPKWRISRWLFGGVGVFQGHRWTKWQKLIRSFCDTSIKILVPPLGGKT